VAIGPTRGVQLWLEGPLGFEPRVVNLDAYNCHLIWGECGPCPVFARYILAYGEGSSWKVVWANRKKGQGGGSESAQQAVEGNGP
jgi:hypothetical protein